MYKRQAKKRRPIRAKKRGRSVVLPWLLGMLVTAALSRVLSGADASPGPETDEPAPPAESAEAPAPDENAPISYAVGVPVASFGEIAAYETPVADISGFDASVMNVTNATGYMLDVDALLEEPLALSPDSESGEPIALIIHTHASEAYTPTEAMSYVPTDPSRTEDTAYNMVRVGDEVERVLTEAGIAVVHDETLYDYPTYTGSYTRALGGIEAWLEKYPSIQIVLDIHRDSIQLDDGSEFGSVVETGGEESAQIMYVVGSGEGGLYHPNWLENLKFALRLHRQAEAMYPGLVRRLSLRTERFNQHATPGSLIIEIGCAGNTLEQSLVAARDFAGSAAVVINQLSK